MESIIGQRQSAFTPVSNRAFAAPKSPQLEMSPISQMINGTYGVDLFRGDSMMLKGSPNPITPSQFLKKESI